MNYKEMYNEFCLWMISQKDPDYTINIIDEDSVDFVTEKATAHVQFYHLDFEVVSFTIDSPESDEPLFFLHFELKDMEHAQQLFKEMIQSLKDAESKIAKKILLCCTSGFTTSFFADKLRTAAEALGLNYTIDAVPYNQLFEAGQNQDMILLAPQIGYQLNKAKEILKKKIILQIPTEIFARYDVNGMLDLIKENFGQKEESEETVTEDVHDPEWDSSILVVAIIHRNHKYELHYRGVDNEKPLKRGVVIKDKFDIHDLEDVFDVMFIRHPQMAGVAIIAPGVVCDGVLTLPTAKIFNEDIVGYFTRKYHRTFVLINDANAAAVGYYANHQDCGDLIAYYHPLGNNVGGAGVIINGDLHFGKMDIAGECTNYLKLLNFSEDRFDLARTPEGIVELITKIVVPMICTVGPDTLAVFSELLLDTEDLRRGLMKYIPERHLPDIRRLDRNLYEVFYGGGVQLYNVLHGTVKYREDLDEYRTVSAKEE